MPELWRFVREKGGWEPQKTMVRKGSEELPPPLSHDCFLGFPSSLFSLKRPEFRHKRNFFGPLLVNDKCGEEPTNIAWHLVKDSRIFDFFFRLILLKGLSCCVLFCCALLRSVCISFQKVNGRQSSIFQNWQPSIYELTISFWFAEVHVVGLKKVEL